MCQLLASLPTGDHRESEESRIKRLPFVKVTKGGAFLREQIDKVMFIILL